ncbi:Protein deadpan [Sarcoptes scabiei]|uniref:Protein deadpan n=1 Tax=Sarcoptes scabiei TaxID=52283 RepID=A0A834RG00_SARSC|nr:Protein deadpan [Sarcoptes scabiei]
MSIEKSSKLSLSVAEPKSSSSSSSSSPSSSSLKEEKNSYKRKNQFVDDYQANECGCGSGCDLTDQSQSSNQKNPIILIQPIEEERNQTIPMINKNLLDNESVVENYNRSLRDFYYRQFDPSNSGLQNSQMRTDRIENNDSTLKESLHQSWNIPIDPIVSVAGSSKIEPKQSSSYRLIPSNAFGSCQTALPKITLNQQNDTKSSIRIIEKHFSPSQSFQANQKKISKPMIEKRRRDRINRCLNLLKELIIDSKRYPISNYNKSRFEKADILEITVKYLESLALEERRIYHQGFDDCRKQAIRFIEQELQRLDSNHIEQQQDRAQKQTSIKHEIGDEIKMISNDCAREISKIEEDFLCCDDVDGEREHKNFDKILQQKFKSILENLNKTLDDCLEMHSKQLSQIRPLNLSSLFAELNEIKSRSASVSDSDEWHSDGNYSSDNERWLLKNKIATKSVIQHTRNYGKFEQTSSIINEINQNKNHQNITNDFDINHSSYHLIKKLDRLNLDHYQKNHTQNHFHLCQHQNKAKTIKSSSSGSSPYFSSNASSVSSPSSSSSSSPSSYSSSFYSSSTSSSSSSSSSSSTKSSSGYVQSSQSQSIDSSDEKSDPNSSNEIKSNISEMICSTINRSNQSRPSPFYTEVTLSQPRTNFLGNERNGSELPNYEAIWRPWGYGHQ